MQLRSIGIKSLAIGCGLLFAAASAAHASSVTLTLPGGINQAVNPGVNGGLNVTFQGDTTNGAYVGAINWTVTGANTAGFTPGQAVSTFCIQGLQDVITGGTYTYNVVNLNSPGLPQGGADDSLLNSVSAKEIQGFADTYFSNVGGSVGSFNANEVAAAFQMAIWEIEYDGGQSGESFPQAANYNYFAQGNFKATANNSDGIGAISLANTWLNNFSSASGVTSLALASTTAQDQFIYQPGGGSTPPTVPLPAAFPAGVALLGSLFGARKIRHATR